jgi:PAS domain S-box-containing protein
METIQEGFVPHRSVSSAIPTGDSTAVPNGANIDASTQELIASRNHYRRVVQALSVGVLVQDRAGRVLSVNGAADEILGVDLLSLPGQSTAGVAWDIVDERGAAVAPKDRPGRRCIETGRPTIGEVFGMRVPGGALRWIEIDASPLRRAGEDRPYAVVSTIRDVTDRKAAQRAATVAEHRHQLVLAHAVEGYHVVDASGLVLEANPSSSAGPECVDDDGRLTFGPLDATDRQTMNDVLATALERPGETRHVDVRVRSVCGVDCWLELSVTNHLDDPAVDGIVINHRDVTGRRAAEALRWSTATPG